MKNSKYRTVDYTTNIIVPSKTRKDNHHFTHFQTFKQQVKNSSSKKISDNYQQSITHNVPQCSPNVIFNLKVFDRIRRNDKIRSKNDRVDLYLHGGQVINSKQTTMVNTMNKLNNTNSDIPYESFGTYLHERTIYEFIKNKKANEIQCSSQCQTPIIQKEGRIFQPSRISDREAYNQIASKRKLQRDNDQIILVKTIQEEVKQQTKKVRRSLINFMSAQSQGSQRSHISKKNSHSKNPLTKKLSNSTTYNKNNLNSNTNSASKQKKISLPQNIDKEKKSLKHPLFYLQQKEIAHIKAESFIVMQYPSCQIIIGHYFRKVAEIASLTKIMTFYTIWSISEKYLKNVSTERIEIDEEAELMTGTSAQIFVGDVYTVQQLLYGLMLPSGNDAAVALAKWGGTLLKKDEKYDKNQKDLSPLKIFISYMNSLAANLNLINTKFTNPHGLPNIRSGSNPQQLALLVSQCLKSNLFRKIIQTKKFHCWTQHNGIKHESIWENTNKLLRRPNFIGGKTGVTITAGPCLASCYEYGSKIFIIILLRTTKLSKRFKQTRQILALALSKLDKKEYSSRIKQILKQDIDLDSDNSEDEQQFCFQRNDVKQMNKRKKILTYEM